MNLNHACWLLNINLASFGDANFYNKSTLIANLKAIQTNYIYDNYPKFMEYLVADNPGHLLENVKAIRLANGTSVSYNSSHLDPRETPNVF